MEALADRSYATEEISKPEPLLGKESLLLELFPNPKDRPTTRWLDDQCKRRLIPFIRIGRLIWFDLAQVRKSIAARHTIQSRRA